MKKLLCFLALSFAIHYAYAQDTTTCTIYVINESNQKGTLYLYDFEHAETPVDSCRFTKDTLVLHAKSNYPYFSLRFAHFKYIFFKDYNQPIWIHFNDFKEDPHAITFHPRIVSKSHLQEVWHQYDSIEKKFNWRLLKLPFKSDSFQITREAYEKWALASIRALSRVDMHLTARLFRYHANNLQKNPSYSPQLLEEAILLFDSLGLRTNPASIRANTYQILQDLTYLRPGAMIEDFNLLSPDNKVLDTKNYRGKKLLIYFWSRFSPLCRAETAALRKHYKKLVKQNIDLLGISYDMKQTAWKQAIEEEPTPWPQGWLHEATRPFVLAKYNVYPISDKAYYYPRTVLFSEDGHILKINPTMEELIGL
jgi:peroxiredoxin